MIKVKLVVLLLVMMAVLAAQFVKSSVSSAGGRGCNGSGDGAGGRQDITHVAAGVRLGSLSTVPLVRRFAVTSYGHHIARLA